MAMRGDDLLDQGRQAHPLEGLARTGQLGELAQDVAATLHLLAQQPDVLDMRRVVAERLFELARHQRDGGERRSELVRRRGREPVELGEMLLAREHDLGRRQRLGELARFLDDLPRIDADIADAQQDGEPDPDHVGLRQLERIVARPRQRIVHEHQDGGAQDGEAGEHQRHARRQGGGRDQHRPEKKKRERVLQAAGEEQQHRELRDVEGEQPGRAVGLEPLVAAEAQPQCDIEPGIKADDRQARPQRQFEIESVIHHQDGGGLTEDREPAQAHQRIETHIAQRVVGVAQNLGGHDGDYKTFYPAARRRPATRRRSAAGASAARSGPVGARSRAIIPARSRPRAPSRRRT